MNIGVVGIGKMGSHMVANLLKAGHQVWAVDPVEAAVQRVVAQGAKAAASPKEALQHCDTVICSLPDTPAVEKVFWPRTGLSPTPPRGSCSSTTAR